MDYILGLLLLSLTFLPNLFYIISSIIGYLLFGIGLGMYAHHLQIQQLIKRQMIKWVLPLDCIKWLHHLGNAFGVALSSTIYGVCAAKMNLELGGLAGVLFNAIIVLTAFFVIFFLIPNKAKRA